jgi:hypothetical protein
LPDVTRRARQIRFEIAGRTADRVDFLTYFSRGRDNLFRHDAKKGAALAPRSRFVAERLVASER